MEEDPLSKEELVLSCYHEAGHAAVAWFFRENMQKTGIILEKSWGAQFSIHSPVDERSPKRVVEIEIIRKLGGRLAEHRFRDIRPPLSLIDLSDDATFRDSDFSKISNLLRLLGYNSFEAGHDYLLRLQARAWGIVTESKTWAAISAIADCVLKHEDVGGTEIEEIFRQHDAPQE